MHVAIATYGKFGVVEVSIATGQRVGARWVFVPSTTGLAPTHEPFHADTAEHQREHSQNLHFAPAKKPSENQGLDSVCFTKAPLVPPPTTENLLAFKGLINLEEKWILSLPLQSGTLHVGGG